MKFLDQNQWQSNRKERVVIMVYSTSHKPCPAILLIGASRGLGHAMAAELLKKGWNVVGTARPVEGRTQLHDLADENQGRVEVETVDICEPEQIAALRARLSGRVFDILFVNAGAANANPNDTIGEVSTEEFIRVMQEAGVQFYRQDGTPREGKVRMDWDWLISVDSLISQPPRSLGPDLNLVGWFDERIDIIKRLWTCAA